MLQYLFTKNNIKKVIFFGSGTSYNVSILGTYYFKHLVGIDAEYQYPTVFKNYEKAKMRTRAKGMMLLKQPRLARECALAHSNKIIKKGEKKCLRIQNR